MQLLNSKTTNVSFVNNNPEGADLKLKINVDFNLYPAENDNTVSKGVISLNIQDVNDDNDYPFIIDVVYEGVLKYVPGENVAKLGFEVIFKELKHFVALFTKDLGYEPIDLPNMELNLSSESEDFVQDLS